LSVAVRAGAPALVAATENPTLPSPLPDVGVVNATHASFVVTDHVHELAVWIATVPVPPWVSKAAEGADNANAQEGAVRSSSDVQDAAHAASPNVSRAAAPM